MGAVACQLWIIQGTITNDVADAYRIFISVDFCFVPVFFISLMYTLFKSDFIEDRGMLFATNDIVFLLSFRPSKLLKLENISHWHKMGIRNFHSKLQKFRKQNVSMQNQRKAWTWKNDLYLKLPNSI